MSKKRSKAKQRAQEPQTSPQLQPQPLVRRRCVSIKQLRAQARELVRKTPTELLAQLYPFSLERKGYWLLGARGIAWEKSLTQAHTLRLKSIGLAADPKEWDGVALVWLQYQEQQNRRRYQVLNGSGQVEAGTITPEGTKDGAYTLYHSMKGLKRAYYQSSEQQLEATSYPYEVGAFFHGLPCGRFTVTDENGTKLCAGCYELIALQHSELTVDARELAQRLGPHQEVRKLYRRHKKALKARRATDTQQLIAVSTARIVVRYDYLSRRLADDAVQGFSIGPYLPAVTIQRKPQESWLEATSRTHHEVLRLVERQVAALQAAQDAAYEQENTDKPGENWLGAAQSKEIVAGCEQGGYGQWALKTMAQSADGTYLRALLLSSSDEPPAQANYPGYFVARNGRIVSHEVEGKPLPLWPAATPKPPQLNSAPFAWMAAGSSIITGAAGESLGQVWYNQGYACSFKLFNEAAATGEELTCEDGIVQPSMRLELYQDFRARFPAAILTVDLTTGQFEGPYEVLYDIDELFAAGYHGELLEFYGTYTVGNNTKNLKRLRQFYSSTDYRREQGVYEQGKPRVTATHELEDYRDHWGH